MRIARLFRLLAVVLCVSSAARAEAPFTLAIDAQQGMVDSRFHVLINIILMNISGHDIYLRDTSTDCDYMVSVSRADGFRVAETKRGQAVKMCPSFPTGRDMSRLVKPNKTAVYGVLASELFDLGHPGQYLIQVQRNVSGNLSDPSKGTVKSNIITVTVGE